MSSNIGQGSIGKSNKAAPSGAPFPSTSANNGASVDSITGQIVLGNDGGDPLKPAQLLSTREIVTNGRFVRLINNTASAQVLLTDNIIRVMNLLNNSFINVAQTAIAIQDGSGLANPQIQFSTLNFADFFIMDILGGAWRVLDNTVAPVITITNGTGNTVIRGSLQTGDPNGAGTATPWKLGKKKAGAVALDAANFVEVNINGTVVKLGIVV